jgi:hypothetical protein
MLSIRCGRSQAFLLALLGVRLTLAVRSGRSKIPFCRASLRPSGDLVGLASFDYREWSDGGACASGRGFVS